MDLGQADEHAETTVIEMDTIGDRQVKLLIFNSALSVMMII